MFNSSSSISLQEKDHRNILDEIRKMKAIIVKQENRIRALEGKASASGGDETDARNSNKNGSAAGAASLAAADSSHASESANDHATSASAAAADNAHDED